MTFLVPIDSATIQITGVHPLTCFESSAFYLGYGRNAWNSTWTNKYYPDSCSFDFDELKSVAEQRRVQGSVFKIEAIPAYVIRYPTNTFAITPINDHSAYEYDRLLGRIDSKRAIRFWEFLPRKSQNWLLIFNVSKENPISKQFVASMQKSRSSGPRYYLNWHSEKPKAYGQFLNFSKQLEARLFNPKN